MFRFGAFGGGGGGLRVAKVWGFRGFRVVRCWEGSRVLSFELLSPFKPERAHLLFLGDSLDPVSRSPKT